MLYPSTSLCICMSQTTALDEMLEGQARAMHAMHSMTRSSLLLRNLLLALGRGDAVQDVSDRIRDAFGALLVICGAHGSTTLRGVSASQLGLVSSAVEAFFAKVGRGTEGVTIKRGADDAVKLVSQSAALLLDEEIPEPEAPGLLHDREVRLVVAVTLTTDRSRYLAVPLVSMPCSRHTARMVACRANDCWAYRCQCLSRALAGWHETDVGILQVHGFAVTVVRRSRRAHASANQGTSVSRQPRASTT